jgi:hypothetical protein
MKMLNAIVTEKVRKAGSPLADILSRMTFAHAEEAVAELWDMVNERRDTLVNQAKEMIEKIKNMPDYPTMTYTDTVRNLHNTIAILQGSTTNAVHDTKEKLY